jgi:geranylgeranyl diphosphate synthase, type I
LLRPAVPSMTFADEHTALVEQVEQLMSSLLFGESAGHLVGEISGQLTPTGELPNELGQIGLYHLQAGGRRLRARLALAATAALGGEPQHAIGWAAACELLHNATLVHDDVQDGDRMRRGRETVWAKYGLSQAINVGDLMLMIPLQALERTELAADKKWQLAMIYSRSAEAVVRGQSGELSLPSLLSDARLRGAYEKVVQDKTSALFTLPVQGAALIAGRSLEEVQKSATMVTKLGVIFQICDDLLDFLDRKGRGAAGEDLREGKVSSLIVQYLAQNGPDGELNEFLLMPRQQVSSEKVEYWKRRLGDSGAVEQTKAWARDLGSELERGLATWGEKKMSKVIAELLHAVIAQIQ